MHQRRVNLDVALHAKTKRLLQRLYRSLPAIRVTAIVQCIDSNKNIFGTKYLNQVYTITREVTDRATGAIQVAADYSELGWLLVTAMLITLALPLLAIGLVRITRLRSA